MDLLNISLERDGLTELFLWPRNVELHFQPALYTVLFGDFDHMKKILDNHGIPAGEATLEAVGVVLRGLNWPHQMSFRFGGDEFLVVARDYSVERAELMAGDINRQMQNRDVEVGYLKTPVRDLSLTWGVAVGLTATTGVENLIGHAQAQVKRAKLDNRRGSLNTILMPHDEPASDTL